MSLGTSQFSHLVDTITTNRANLIGYIQFAGVQGPIAEAQHSKWSSIYSVQAGVLRPIATITGQQRIERATMSDVLIVKELDKASPPLFQKSAEGHVFSDVKIELVQNVGGSNATVWCKITLHNVFISNYSTQVLSTTPGLAQLESLSLNYAKIEIQYTDFGADGKSAGQTKGSWDVMKGQA